MNGEMISIKGNCADRFYLYSDAIQINEPHECGEIINNYFLIVNSDIVVNNDFSKEKTRKYKPGDYIKVVYIKALDLFKTDINYSNRTDLQLLQISMDHDEFGSFTNYLYRFCGYNELDNNRWRIENSNNIKECLEIMSGKRSIPD